MAMIFDTFTLSMVFFGLQIAITLIFAITMPTYQKKYLNVITLGIGLESFSVIFALIDAMWAPFVLNMLLMVGSVCIIVGLLLIIHVQVTRKLLTLFFAIHTLLFFYFTFVYYSLEIRLVVYGVEITFMIFILLYHYWKDIKISGDKSKMLLMLLYIGYVVLVDIRAINTFVSREMEIRYLDMFIHHVYLYYGIIFALVRGIAVVTIVASDFQEELKSLSNTDHLTGLANIRSLMDRMNQELHRSKRFEKVMTIALIDLDDFKVVNDTYGHVFGDEVLKVFSDIAKGIVRNVDLVGRYGGEEFLIIFPETTAEKAQLVIARIMATLKEQSWAEDHVKITFSTGILQIKGDMVDLAPRTLVDMADRAMYRAKEEGKNRSYICKDIEKGV